MAYNNLFLRSILSCILLAIYFFSLGNINYFIIFGLFIYLAILTEVFIYFKTKIIIINLYVILSFLCFLFFSINFFNYYLINLTVFTIILFDTFSYFIGSLIGKNYVFKNLSPKKTLEGYLGGFILTNIFCIPLFLIYFNQVLINNFIIINTVIIFSIFGDLLQSYFKRINSLKDSSNFLPGHGGFFDRFDSFISTIIFLIIYSYFAS